MMNPPPVPELLVELATFRARLAHLATSSESLHWTDRPADMEWSLTEVACHLRDVEIEVHQARIRALLAEEGAFLPGVDADEWAEQRNYCYQDGPRALADFLNARGETINLLEPLAPEMWERRGQHTFFGPTSLQEIVFLAVRHDRVHDEQIDRLLGKK